MPVPLVARRLQPLAHPRLLGHVRLPPQELHAQDHQLVGAGDEGRVRPGRHPAAAAAVRGEGRELRHAGGALHEGVVSVPRVIGVADRTRGVGLSFELVWWSLPRIRVAKFERWVKLVWC